MRVLTFLTAVVVSASLSVSIAHAAGPTGPGSKPSLAYDLPVGVPVTVPGPESDQDRYFKLPGTARLGDKYQLAVANDGKEGLGVTNSVFFRVCPPIDDFDGLNSCKSQKDDVLAGQLGRVTVEYEGAVAGQGYLVASEFNQYGGSLTLTLERVIPKVNVGVTVKARTKRNLKVTGVARLGDNSPVPDGTPIFLQWGKKATEKSLRTIATGTTVGGAAQLQGLVPRKLKGKRIYYRVCAVHATERSCSRSVKVRVRKK